MIKRVALIAVIAFFLLVATAKAATLTGNVAFTVHNANGTDINYKLYNVTSTSGTVTLYNGGIDTLDNSGGGIWKREDVFKLAAATAEDAQYCIKISGDWINVTNSTGALKASLYDPLFWDYVSQNGSDIRITNQDGQLYFWIEDFNSATQQATIWVNLTAGSTELNIAYGNPSASISVYDNGSKTFLFFDDFETFDGWVQYGSGSVVQSSARAYSGTYSAHKIDYNDPNGAYKPLGRVLGRDIVLEALINRNSAYTGGQFDRIGLINSTGYGYGVGYDHVAHETVVDIRTAYTPTTTNGPGSTDHEDTWYTLRMILTQTDVIAEKLYKGVLEEKVVVTNSAYNSFTNVYIFGGYDYWVDDIKISSLADPATFSTPYAENLTTINATASVNSVNYVAPALNITIPYQTFTLPPLSTTNWFNFSAEQGQFSANVTFSFTSTFTQTQTANFTELVVSSDVYVPANCTGNTLTISFNTSDVPSGVVIYSYNLSVLVNGSEVEFSKTATENLGVWYFTVSLNNIKQGWHSVKVLIVYRPAYLNITVYDANNVTTLLDKTLNVTVYDSNFNVLTSATVNKTANLSVVFAGKVFVRINNWIGVARQLETTITPGNTTHITFYFPSANVVIATLQFIDYTNSFSNATVIIKRYISRNVIVPVDVQKMTAQLQTTHYLIANTPYEVYVTNGEDTRDLGYISVAYSQTIQLVIGNILNVQAFPYVGVAFNISTSNNTISITYKTIKGTTSSVSVEITNSTGYEVYNTTLTTPEGKITYLITNPNESYYVSFHAENSFEPVNYKTIVSVSGVQFEPVLPVVSGGAALAISAQSLPVWARLMFFGGLGIFVALLFRRQNVAIGLTMSFAVLALFTVMGILPLSTNVLWVLAILVVVAWFVWWRDRR